MRMYLQTCSRYLTFTFTKQNENGPLGKPGTDTAGANQYSIMKLRWPTWVNATYCAVIKQNKKQKLKQPNNNNKTKTKRNIPYILLDEKFS